MLLEKNLSFHVNPSICDLVLRPVPTDGKLVPPVAIGVVHSRDSYDIYG